MEGEEVCFLVVFIDLERQSFAYIPEMGSKFTSKIYLVGWIDFKFLEKRFLEWLRDLKV